MNLKDLSKKLNMRLKRDDIEAQIEKNEEGLKYLVKTGQSLSKHQKEAIAIAVLSGRDLEQLTLHQKRSVYQIGCNLGKTPLIRYFYEKEA